MYVIYSRSLRLEYDVGILYQMKPRDFAYGLPQNL